MQNKLNSDIISRTMKKNFLKKFRRCTSYILLGVIIATISINSNILCIESDGTSSIETAPLGICQTNYFLNSNIYSFIENDEVSSAHDECFQCTDITLSQTLSSKLKSEIDHTIVPGTIFVASTAFEIPVFTEPIVSLTPSLELVPNQLHKHLQTIIFLI